MHQFYSDKWNLGGLHAAVECKNTHNTTEKKTDLNIMFLNMRHFFLLETQITELFVFLVFTFVSPPQLNRTSFQQGQKGIS